MTRKNTGLFLVLAVTALFLISWGVAGHRAIGKIAEKHLSPNAKAAVQALLGGESLADVSTWADEVRNQPEYQQTGSWHFINLPIGLSYAAFKQQVESMTGDNVYNVLLRQEQLLRDKTTPREKRVEALKFIVHFVGDLHQPMHVSRVEDKGGNTIQLNYEGKGTNLHSLWDTKLLEHPHLSYEDIADKYDQATPAEIRQWQQDPLMTWIWESYVVSSQLYAEVDAMKSRSIDDSYYQAHLPVLKERIEKAGIRLAGVLNELFKNGPTAADKAGAGSAVQAGGQSAGAGGQAGQAGDQAVKPVQVIDIKDADKHINDNVRVCAKVFGYKALEGMTLVNLGAAYPDQLLTVVLKKKAKDAYEGLDGQTVCVTGTVLSYKGKPEIVVTDPDQIGKANQ